MTEDIEETETQSLTLEELLALAKKVKFWQRREDENEFSTSFTKEGWYKGIQLYVGVKRCSIAAFGGDSYLGAIYNGIHIGFADNHSEICHLFANASCKWKYEDREEWAEVKQEYFLEARKLARKGMK